MTKFTEGEWLLSEAAVVTSICSIPSGHFHIETKDIHKFIAIQNDYREESKANAHLIAAAPEMYKMIESLANELDSCVNTINKQSQALHEVLHGDRLVQVDDYDKELLHDVQVLLAKARGEFTND
jgi:hypothetical protein